MGGQGSNSPMSYNNVQYPPVSNTYNNYGNPFITSSPIPTPMQHPSNSTSSSNRSSLYGFTSSPYSNTMNYPQNVSNPSSFSYKPSTASLFAHGHSNNSISRSFHNNLPSPSPSFMHQNGPSPWRMNDCLPSDILNPRNDYLGFSPNMLGGNSMYSNNKIVEDAASKKADHTARPDNFVVENKNVKDREKFSETKEVNSNYEVLSVETEAESLSRPKEHLCDNDYSEIAKRDAPLEDKKGPTEGFVERNGRKIFHCLLSKDEIKKHSQYSPNSMVLEGFCNFSPMILEMKHLVNLYVSNSKLTTVPTNIKKLINLEVLDFANNKIKTVPSTICELPKLKRLYLENNELEDIPLEFGRMYNIEVLDLSGNPLKSELAEAYGKGGEEGKNAVLSYLLNAAVNKAMLKDRQWIEVPSNASKHNLPTFSLLCYNILADNYATPAAHTQCPSWALHWKYRSNFVFKELHHYAPDIFALQELQDEQYCTVFKVYFEKHGYSSTFYPKTRSTTMSEKERRNVDGCALFWKNDKFELESESTVNYNQIASNFGKIMRHDPSTKEFLNRIMPRDNVALIVTLKPKTEAYGIYPNFDQQQPITIANTHLHWDPEYSDVKIVQSMLLVRELKRILSERAERTGVNIAEFPLLILGDFNSLPNSAVYDYLANNRVSRHHPEFKGFCHYDISFIAGRSDEHYYYNTLNLTSAVNVRNMPYTNFTQPFKGCIDYIFVTKASLQTLNFLGPMDEGWMRRNHITGFPNENVPSDHIPIMGCFAMMTVDDNLKLKIAKPQSSSALTITSPEKSSDITSSSTDTTTTTATTSSQHFAATNVFGFNNPESNNESVKDDYDFTIDNA
uniref:poly(A)-specific ribonuclease n=1 Tax=Panagrolaimus superbus TaxID=310955 RepID=A0A914YUE4_9BILA